MILLDCLKADGRDVRSKLGVDLKVRLDDLGVPTQLTKLPTADIAFVGRGENDTPHPVGIEHKMVSEFVGTIADTRFRGGQLPRLCEQFKTVWIVVEGLEYYPSEKGLVKIHGCPPKHWKKWETVEAFKLTLEQRAGVYVRLTRDRYETVRWLAACYRWWTEKSFLEHRSHIAYHKSRVPNVQKAPRKAKARQALSGR